MSINLTYLRFSPEEFVRATSSQSAWQAARGSPLPGLDLAQLQEMSKNPTPEAMQKFLAAMQAKAADPARVDLDKWWHVFLFLLTGVHEIQEGHKVGHPLHNVIFGGTPTAVSTGYGPVRALSGDQLREVSEALSGVTAESFMSRWNIEEMRAKDIYACPYEEEEEEEREMALELLNQLKTFLAEAHAQGQVVVIYGH